MTRMRAAFFAIAVAGAAVDLATKSLAFSRVPLGRQHDVIDGCFTIDTALNPGMAWSLAQGQARPLTIISLVAVPLIVVLFLRQKPARWIGAVALALVLAGTLGNLHDRLAIGAVRDFLKFHWHGRAFPTFNVADAYICVGVALLAVEMLFFDRRRPAADAAKPEDARAEDAAAPPH